MKIKDVTAGGGEGLCQCQQSTYGGMGGSKIGQTSVSHIMAIPHTRNYFCLQLNLSNFLSWLYSTPVRVEGPLIQQFYVVPQKFSSSRFLLSLKMRCDERFTHAFTAFSWTKIKLVKKFCFVLLSKMLSNCNHDFEFV